jgi:hypothetical protein
VRVKGEIYREGSKVRVKRGRDMQRKEGGLMAECDIRVRKHCIYSCFFLSAGWLNRFGSVWFNQFQTLETKTETEPNRNFFVIF